MPPSPLSVCLLSSFSLACMFTFLDAIVPTLSHKHSTPFTHPSLTVDMSTAPPRHPAHAWEIFPVFNPAAPAAMHAPTAVLITSSLPLTYSDPHC